MKLLLKVCTYLFEDPMEDVLRCLDKSSYVAFDGSSLLISDDKHIYYFGSLEPTTKKFKRFYNSHLDNMIGKMFYADTTHNYGDRAEDTGNISTGGKKIYVWKG